MAQTPGTGCPCTGRTSTQNDFRLAVANSSVVMLGIAVLGLGLGIISTRTACRSGLRRCYLP